MSIMGPIPQSDSLYPVNTLWSLEGTKEWLESQRGEYEGKAHGFFRTLENMKSRTEFQPSYWSNEPKPMIFEGPLHYREPVWKIIHEVAAKHSPKPDFTAEECAEWLQGLLVHAVKHKTIRAEVERFKASLLSRNVPVAVDSAEEAAVQVRIDPALSGSKATESLLLVVGELLPKIVNHIEKLNNAYLEKATG